MKRNINRICESCIESDLGCSRKDLELCELHKWKTPKRIIRCTCGNKSFSYFNVVSNVNTKSNEVGQAMSYSSKKILYSCDKCCTVYSHNE